MAVDRTGDLLSSRPAAPTITHCDGPSHLPRGPGQEDYVITSVPTHGTGAGPARRVSARKPAARVPHLAHLPLDQLREYRQELITEESRVSYWRRILQARIDTGLDEGDDVAPSARLRSVLSEHQETSRRLAVLPVHDATSTPPLPDLAVLWEAATELGSDDDALGRLAAAEAELSAYRRSLHERLDDATSELIARYRDEPALALRALPLPRGCDVA